MKRLIMSGTIVFVSVIALFAFARQRMWSDSDKRLGEFCKEKTQAYFLARGETPTNWLERPVAMKFIGFNDPVILDLDGLFKTDWNFYGHWRVGQRQFDVKCVSGFGRSLDHLHYEIDALP